MLLVLDVFGQINVGRTSKVNAYPARDVGVVSYSQSHSGSTESYQDQRFSPYSSRQNRNTVGRMADEPAYHGVATYQSYISEPFASDPYSDSNSTTGPRKVPKPDDPGTEGSPIGSVWWLLIWTLAYVPYGMKKRKKKNEI